MTPPEARNPRDPGHRTSAELEEELAGRERQLERRPIIDQAKGMLMQDFGLDQDGAFALLNRISQDSNVKLHDLAELLVAELRGSSSSATAESAAGAINGLAERLKHQMNHTES